jgi:hypothetical protein
VAKRPIEYFKVKQCPAYAFMSKNRKATAWFCVLEDGHEGEHFSPPRKRWPDPTGPEDAAARLHAEGWLAGQGLLGAPKPARRGTVRERKAKP